MGDKDAKSHQSNIVYIKQDFGFTIIQKHKLTFQKISREISVYEHPYAISGSSKTNDKSADAADFWTLFYPRRFLKHSQNHVPVQPQMQAHRKEPPESAENMQPAC